MYPGVKCDMYLTACILLLALTAQVVPYVPHCCTAVPLLLRYAPGMCMLTSACRHTKVLTPSSSSRLSSWWVSVSSREAG